MPISEISKGVFYVSTPKTEKYKMSAAGQYTTTFTKAKADLWDLSLKQALLKIQSEEEAYQLQMKSYLERQKQLDSLEAELNLAREQGNQKAINDAYKNWISVKATQDRANADRALRATERVYPTESTSYGLGGGFGAGARKAMEKLSPEQAALIKAIATEAGGNVAATMAGIDDAIRVGTLKTTTPDIATAVRGVALNEAANIQIAQTGDDEEEVSVRVTNEANIADPAGNYSDAFLQLLTTPPLPPTGGIGGRTGAETRVSGPVSRPKFTGEPEVKGVDIKFPELQLDLLKEDIRLGREALEKDKPTKPESDLITTARDIFAGRAGPTMGASAAYKQRLVLDTLLRMSPEERAGIVKKYGGAQPAAEAVVKAAAETPAPAPAAPAPAPPGAATYRDEATGAEGYFTPGNEKVETKPGTAAAPPAEPTVTPQAPAPMIPQTQAPSVPVSQPQPPAIDPVEALKELLGGSSNKGLRQALRSTRKPEEELLNIPPGSLSPPLPEPTRYEQPRTVEQAQFTPLSGQTSAPGTIVAPPPVTTTREENAPTPVERTKEQMEESVGQQLPTIPSLNKPLEVIRTQETKQPKVPEAPPGKAGGTATTPKGRQMQYVEKVYEGAKELVAKKDKLNRVTSSGEGKLASEIYFGNKNQNKDFKKTWEEITISFADNPAARERAHTIAMALDLRSKSLNKTPEVA